MNILLLFGALAGVWLLANHQRATLQTKIAPVQTPTPVITVQDSTYGRGTVTPGETGNALIGPFLPNPDAHNFGVGLSSTALVSVSPDTIAVSPGSDNRTTAAAVQNATAQAAAGLGATLPAIGQWPNNSSLWANISLGSGQWRWDSIDGSKLSFISDATGKRIA